MPRKKKEDVELGALVTEDNTTLPPTTTPTTTIPPTTVPPTTVAPTTTVLPDPKYKFTIYTNRGVLRSWVSVEALLKINSEYRDIVQALYPNRWSSQNEILSRYRLICQNNPNIKQRTDEEFLEAINKMVSMGVIEER